MVQSPSLALLPAGLREQRIALALVVLSCLVFIAAVPFARHPLQPVPAFLPVYQSALVVCDVITAVLMFGQFRILQSRALLVLAGAYLFCALMAVAHALSFPGLFAPTGLIGAGPQTTAWLYFLWHGSFPLLVIAYAEIGRRERGAGVSVMRVAPAILAAIVAAFIAAAALTVLTTAGHELLPPIMAGNADASTKVYVATASWMLTLVAIAVLWWRHRPLTMLDMWLMVVLFVWVFDIALSSVLNAGRYDVGWYTGRVYGLVAGSFILGMLLLENSRLYAELARARESDSRHAAELAAVLNTVVDGIITTDAHGLVTSMNPAAVRIFGYEAREVVGLHFRILLPEARHDANQEPRILDSGHEGIGRRKDGRTFPMELSTNEMLVGNERHFVGTVRDVTVQRQTEASINAAKEEADIASRAKSTFLATMSHEIRTPMNGVLAMIELVSLTRLDSEQRNMIEVVRESGRSLLRIIDDILDFSKIEAGKLELRPEVTSIADTVQSVRNLFAGSASSRGLTLQQETDPRISAAVLVDSLRLRQILHNLVSNAIKFSIPGGTVEVRAEWMGRSEGKDEVRFSVRDNGIGVSPDQQRRLFQPFHQAEGSTTRRHGGTGLGLTICRRLADAMGGTIEMISAPGKGTTMLFTLQLPIANPAELVQPSKEDVPQFVSTARQLHHIPVLLAEDHPINRLVMQRQLDTLGYVVETAEDGREAVEKWKTGRFGLIITDCHMPEMDGYDLTRDIRGIEATRGLKRTPIIACTANALEGEAAKCFAAGMDDYISKPIELAKLQAKLDRWLPLDASREDEPMLDRAALAEISGGDEDAERAILQDFRRYNLEDRKSLMKALESRDADAVVHASHRIKGASRSIGALRLAAVSERLEEAGRAKSWLAINDTMEEFRREFELLDAHIAGHRETKLQA